MWKQFCEQSDIPMQNKIESLSIDLGQNVELKKLFVNEKKRCEQYHIHLESLKNEYSKLEAENIKLKNQVETLCKDNDNIKQSYESLLLNKSKEIEILKENFNFKLEEHRQNEEEYKTNLQSIEKDFLSQIKDLKTQLTTAKSRASQHAHQSCLQEDKLKWVNEQSAVYIKQVESNMKAKLDEIRKSTQLMIQKKNDELQAQVLKTVNISKEKTSLHLQVQSLLEEVDQLSQEKRILSQQIEAAENENKKAVSEQRVIITTLQGEKNLVDSRLKDRSKFCEQLKKEMSRLEAEVRKNQVQINTLNLSIQSMKTQHQAELQWTLLNSETLKHALKQQEESYKRKITNEQFGKQKLIQELLKKNKELNYVKHELDTCIKQNTTPTNNVIKNMESKVAILESKLSEKQEIIRKLSHTLNVKGDECSRLATQLATREKANLELKQIFDNCQQLVEVSTHDTEITDLLSTINDRSDMHVQSLTRLLENNNDMCKNLKIQLATEKEETKRLIEEMNKYEDMRHCNHHKEMLELVSKIRDLQYQLQSEKMKQKYVSTNTEHKIFSDLNNAVPISE